MTSIQPVLFPVLIDSTTDPLLRAVAAHLARYRGQTRVHTESDLRAFLVWCGERGVEPLKANRAQIELYVRWMQEVRHFQPSTVSRRVSVVAGFYRTCVIDQVIAQSPADHVRRPNVGYRNAGSPQGGTTALTQRNMQPVTKREILIRIGPPSRCVAQHPAAPPAWIVTTPAQTRAPLPPDGDVALTNPPSPAHRGWTRAVSASTITR